MVDAKCFYKGPNLNNLAKFTKMSKMYMLACLAGKISPFFENSNDHNLLNFQAIEKLNTSIKSLDALLFNYQIKLSCGFPKSGEKLENVAELQYCYSEFVVKIHRSNPKMNRYLSFM